MSDTNSEERIIGLTGIPRADREHSTIERMWMIAQIRSTALSRTTTKEGLSMEVTMKCNDCDFLPGEAVPPPAMDKAILRIYQEIANDHAFRHSGHVVVTLIDGEPKRRTVIAGVVSVTCDICFQRVAKPECVLDDGLIVCRGCSSLDLCRCGHSRGDHEPFDGACLMCGAICEHFSSEEDKPCRTS